MPPTDKCPAHATLGSDDLGARLARLQDCIAEAAGADNRRGLLTDYHEAQAAGAMRAPDDEGVVLVTLIANGESHVYALTKSIADHLREQLGALRRGPAVLAKLKSPAPGGLS